MRDHEEEESAARKVQQLAAEGVESKAEPLEPEIQVNRGLDGGDADHTDLRPGCIAREGLIDGSLSETIPFFSSFFQNLGPRYQAPNSDNLLFAMTPPGRGQVLENSYCDKTVKVDRCNNSKGDGFAATVHQLGNVTMTRSNLAAVNTPDSSRRAVLDPMPEDYESDEMTSAYKPELEASSSGSAPGGELKGMPPTSCKRAICGRRINFDASGQRYGVQCHCMPVSLARRKSVKSFFRTPNQSRTSTLRDLKGKEKELDDNRSSSLTSKRFRVDLGFHNFPQTAPVVLQSRRSDDHFDEIIRIIHAQQCRVVQRRRRLRMLMSPIEPLGRSKEAMDHTLSTLKHWHFLLGLDDPTCPTLASHIFNRAFRMFQRSRWPQQMLETNDEFRVRVLMATAFWVATKVVDTIRKVPRASAMAITASITAQSLVHAELPLLDALNWKLVKY